MSGEPLRVLVADDDEDQRLLLRTLLRRHGITDVHEAADGAEALRRAADLQPALVVLDLAMPVLSGVDVLPSLREVAPAARVVVVSGLPSRRLADTVRQRGAVGFVQKDVATDRLVDAILLAAALTDSAVRIAGSRFPLDRTAPGLARRFVRETVEPATADVVATVELLVSELVTNAVLHAASEPQVEVKVSASTVRVEVFDDVATMPRRRTPDALRPGGRGLHLLDQLASRWGAGPHGRGKVVWFELDRSDESSGFRAQTP